MKECEQCGATKTLDQFKLVSPKRVPRRFCIECYTQNRRKSKSGEKPYDERACHLDRTYSITPEDYDRMLQEQGNKCAICLGDDPKSPRRVNHWYIDHCHKTGKVRGLLCNACNRAIGNFNDDVSNLHRAIEYLAKVR